MIAITTTLAAIEAAERAEWKRQDDEYRLQLISPAKIHVANDFIEDVFSRDKWLQREIRNLQKLADGDCFGGVLGELDYETDVDVTAEPNVPDDVTVGHVRWRGDRYPVVVECKAGVEKVGDRLIKKYVGRVCR